jgi:hypothetical protein
MQTLTLQRAINSILQTNIAVDGIFGAETNQNFKRLQALMKPFLLPNFDGFIAVRCSEVFDNKASDFMFYVRNQEILEALPCTTRAGDYWVMNPISYGGITGTAVLAEGIYPKVWEGRLTNRFGFGSLPELVQVRPVSIYRDGNKDKKIDRTALQSGLFGINAHQQGWAFAVDNWSAGCVTVPNWSWKVWTSLFFELGKHYDLYLVSLKQINPKFA